MTLAFATETLTAWPAAGPPLVLLHPLGVDRTFWRPVLPLLRGRPLVLVDLPGHGRSAAPATPYTIVELADGLASVLRREHRTVDLVGASLGGLVAQALAARHPDLVGRLALVDTVAVYPDEMRAGWRTRAGRARATGLADLVEPTVATWFTDREGALAAALRAGLLATDPVGYAGACDALAAADTRADCRLITAPTLVVCGIDDGPAFTAAARWFAATLSGSRLAWLPGRHAAVLEHPRHFCDELLGFLADAPHA